VTHIVLVDNGSPLVKDLKSTSQLHIIRLKKNYGLAYAQNIGIERAIKLKADYVLFLDQDSVPHSDMVNNLHRSMNDASREGMRVAIAGPITEDSLLGNKGFFVKSFLGVPYKSHFKPQFKAPYSKADFIISSGSLVPLEALKIIGGQRSDYFIDHVDTDWGMRAKMLGYQAIGVRDALMRHRVGDSARRFWLFGWKTIFWHQPSRDYYVFRNTFLMVHDNPFNVWQLHLVIRLFKLMIYFCMLCPDRYNRFLFMMRGVRDGLLNRRGFLDVRTFKLHPIPRTSVDPQ
jgi:rhamnosyltransferase